MAEEQPIDSSDSSDTHDTIDMNVGDVTKHQSLAPKATIQLKRIKRVPTRFHMANQWYIDSTILVSADQLAKGDAIVRHDIDVSSITHEKYINWANQLKLRPLSNSLPVVERVHPNVATNNPHIFGRTYCDSVHTSQQSYGGNPLLGFYFNILNLKKMIQKQNILRFTVLAADDTIPFEQSFGTVARQLLKMEKDGIWSFYRTDADNLPVWSNCSFSWAMCVADMEIRDKIMGRRGARRNSHSESKCHLGVANGITWPQCTNLLEDGIITPSKFLYNVRQYLLNTLQLSRQQANKQGIEWAVSTLRDLAVPKLQWNACLKCVDEPGHIILLGIFDKLFNEVWFKLTRKFRPTDLENNIQGFLTKIDTQIKFKCNAADHIGVLQHYSDMNQAWKNWIQEALCLPYIARWKCGTHLLWHFGRWCSQLFICQTENERLRLEKALKPLLQDC